MKKLIQNILDALIVMAAMAWALLVIIGSLLSLFLPLIFFAFLIWFLFLK